MLKLLDDIHYMITAKVVILLQIQPIILFHTKNIIKKITKDGSFFRIRAKKYVGMVFLLFCIRYSVFPILGVVLLIKKKYNKCTI